MCYSCLYVKMRRSLAQRSDGGNIISYVPPNCPVVLKITVIIILKYTQLSTTGHYYNSPNVVNPSKTLPIPSNPSWLMSTPAPACLSFQRTLPGRSSRKIVNLK